MRAVHVPRPGGPFELIEREVPQSGPGQVRIKVDAYGICHSDSLVKEGHWPGLQYPRVPGHEVAGVVDAVGAGVAEWTAGQRVGVGWYGGHCGHCESCRRGSFITCANLQISGISYDGGYADYMIVPAQALALVPKELSATEAGPLLCAGLGHLGVQFAAKMGFRTVAIARGKVKGSLVHNLGARHYIDNQTQDPTEELMKLGGARVILATVTNAKAMSAMVGGLDVYGKLIVVGAPPEPVELSALQLLVSRRSIMGWPSGTSIDSQDTLAFSVLAGVRSMNEIYPLERAAEAYERMMSGNARFRVVLTTAG